MIKAIDWAKLSGIMAWDVSDAIAKTADEHGIDIGVDAIEPNLPAFIAACLATQAELDGRDHGKESADC
jgi:hypothetical protein